ncbi:hypothetical protein [Pseudomonas citronellolis]|uniref:hypothetical protein n=1 Tax=Pseudomonas citronellolis TaxID=53408 RepID=UPI0023E3C76F|nr:hypothetical protein [Pseudomonas citronellolis]MDF3935861.1 hypothetical protein [Pseudomonas citronellolis]
MSLSLTPASQVYVGQLRTAGGDGSAATASASASAGTSQGEAGQTHSAGRVGGADKNATTTASAGSDASDTVKRLQDRLKELQKQLQEAQQQLAQAQARQYSSDAERTAAMMAIQSRIATISAAMMSTAAALAEAIRNSGGGAGSLVSTSA